MRACVREKGGSRERRWSLLSAYHANGFSLDQKGQRDEHIASHNTCQHGSKSTTGTHIRCRCRKVEVPKFQACSCLSRQCAGHGGGQVDA